MGLFRKDIYVPGKTQYVTKEVNITHKHERQSTSEDARLLHDLESEAFNKITDAVFYNLKPLNMECCVLRKEFLSFVRAKDQYIVIFKLNEQKYEFVIEETEEWPEKNTYEKVQFLFKKLSEEIACELLSEVDLQRVFR